MLVVLYSGILLLNQTDTVFCATPSNAPTAFWFPIKFKTCGDVCAGTSGGLGACQPWRFRRPLPPPEVFGLLRGLALPLFESETLLGVILEDCFLGNSLTLVVWVVVHSVHSVHALPTLLYGEPLGKVLVGRAHYAHRAHFPSCGFLWPEWHWYRNLSFAGV